MKHPISFLILFLISSHAFSQELPGKRDSIFSTVLNEKRVLQIYVPKGYKPDSKEKYDVVYLLDGDSNIKVLSQIQEFTAYQKYTPGLIIVAIFNTDRNRDFLPTATANIKTSGGADKFLAFIKQELMPYIAKGYLTSGQNLLYGHSFGGVFAMYTLLNDPNLFNSYIMADPSFWYDDNSLTKLAAERVNGISGSEKTVFITGREGVGMKEMGINIMDSVLKAKAPADLSYKIVSYDDETHSSIRFKSMYDGLKFSYSGYKNKDEILQFHPMNGIVLKDKPYTLYNVASAKNTNFTTDGTVPTRESQEFEERTHITGPAKLNIKAFTPAGKYDRTATGTFTLGTAPEPLENASGYAPGGVAYAYYEGNWTSIPNFRKLKPKQVGVVDKDFRFNKFPSKTMFACLFEGLIEIKKEGYYVFCLDADDGAKIYLKDKLLINYDGLHPKREMHSFLIPLKKGFYPLRLEYFQHDKSLDLKTSYIVPNANEPVDIPYELLYHKNNLIQQLQD